MKHKADPTKRSPEKANRSVAGFAKAQNRSEQGVEEGSQTPSKFEITYKTKDGTTQTKMMIGKDEQSVSKYFEFKFRHKPISIKRVEKQGVAEGLSEMDNRTSSGDRREKRNNSPEEKAKQDKEQQKRLKDTSPEMRKKLRLPEPKQGVAEEVQELDELNKDTLHSYAKKSEKDQDDQFDKIGKGIRDKDPKSANKAGHKFSMRSIGQNRAEKRLAKEAASPAQQAAIAIAMKRDGKEPKDRLPKKPADEYDRKVVKYLKKKHGMSEGIVDKIKSIKRGMQAKAKADDHFDKAGDPKNANASKDLKKAVRYHNLLNKEEVVLEARKKSFKDVKKKMKEEEKPNKSTVKKGDDLTGKKEPIEINPELTS
jgi:hypothetical protein